MNNLPKPQEQFKRTINKKDVQYEVTINSYEKPIRENAHVRCHTLVLIDKDGENWGHTFLPNQTGRDESAGIFDMVKKHLEKFKNPLL